MMKYLLLTGLFFLVISVSNAQYDPYGRVIVIQDELVDSVLHDYETLRLEIMENPDNKAIPGYRIQIFFDSGPNSSDRAKQAMEEFLSRYPEIPAYVNWKAPNYRVRVGDFRTRLEAEKTLQSILVDYPNAWVIKDEINFP
ncbi:MAG: SPOR domain-containing protein, partial [Bacteroidales bacterium]|nr:SPOR domain-containing protein [Bacteroidales bacterium]